jgi:hypothetical protein
MKMTERDMAFDDWLRRNGLYFEYYYNRTYFNERKEINDLYLNKNEEEKTVAVKWYNNGKLEKI